MIIIKSNFYGLFVSALLATCAQAQNTLPLPITNADQVATDDLGRVLPTYEEVGAPKPNRVVGLFYWQWHTGLRGLPGQFDMSQYLKDKPYFKGFTANPPGGPEHPTFYWGKPIFGYYRSADPWVIRKQLVMFADAGVDFLFLDYTNDKIYDPELQVFMDVAFDLKSQGVAVPRLAFFLNYEPDWKLEHLYKNWYLNPRYEDMWFRWDGKPLMLSHRPANDAKFKDAALIPAAQNYFTYRPTWDGSDGDPHKWSYLHSSNPLVALSPDNKPEQVVVVKSIGGPIWNNFREGGVSAVEGKSYEEQDFAPDWTLPDRDKGIYFQNRWDNAQKLAPPIVLVTGWNEWTASVWESPGVVMLNRTTEAGQGYIVDEFNPQFNRDLEPMTGDYRDNYYWQFIANMRRYKGMEAPPSASGPQKIRIDGDAADWKAVTPDFKDAAHDIANRDFDAQVPNIHYVNTSARNDITSAKVARDSKNIYFLAQTAAPLSPSNGANWMQLFIDADHNAKTGWYGYDFIVNRSRSGNKVSVERNISGKWNWQQVGKANARWKGNSLEIAVPFSWLGIKKDAVALDFKWADNAVLDAPDVMDFYSNGDVAPNTRFNYRYSAAK